MKGISKNPTKESTLVSFIADALYQYAMTRTDYIIYTYYSSEMF